MRKDLDSRDAVGVEVPPLDLAVQPRLLAVPLGFIMLLALLEQPMRGIVMRERFLGAEAVGGVVFWWGSIFLAWLSSVPTVQLLENFASRLRSVLSLGMILGALLYAVAILHQPCFLRFQAVLTVLGNPGARFLEPG